MIYDNQAGLDHTVSLIMYWTKIETFLVRFESIHAHKFEESEKSCILFCILKSIF